MYVQLDGILACPDLGPAGSAGFRRPWLPLLGVQCGPWHLYLGLMYLNLGPMYPNLGFRCFNEPFWHPRRGPVGAKTT